jgi:hypothetical protein
MRASKWPAQGKWFEMNATRGSFVLAVLVSSMALAPPALADAASQAAAHRASYLRALPRSSDSLSLRRTRAGALAALEQLVSKSTGAERRKVLDVWLEVAAREVDPALAKFTIARLTRFAAGLTRAQQAKFAALRKIAFPDRVVLPRSGAIVVRHFVGDEFFRSEVAGYRRHGFTVSANEKRAVAKRGRLYVELTKGDAAIFQPMGDARVHVVIFSGHSDIGGVVEQGLRTAPAQRGHKLIVLLQCIGAQTLPQVSARYPSAQVLTTRGPSYADADFNIIRALLEGFEAGESWAQIRRRARSGGDVANYLFPDDPTLAWSWDLDRDGRTDLGPGAANDPRFDVGRRQVRPGGETLLSAIRYTNAAHRYYAEDTPGAIFSVALAKDRFVGGGIVATTGRRATEVRRITVGGQSLYEVRLHKNFDRSPRSFLAAAIVFELHETLVRVAKREVTPRDRLRALLFAADYVYRMVPTSDEAEDAIARLVRHAGLAKFTYAELERIIFLEKDDSATTKQLDAMEAIARSRRGR